MIEFQQVTYRVHETLILRGVSGHIRAGAITSLIGPSGAGKTTLLKMCNSLISPTAGSILLQGRPLEQIAPTTLRKKVGIALQNAPIVSDSVFDNLALPAKIHKTAFSEADALAALASVGLEANLLHKKARDLSGGQRQRLSIARTLINKPDVLLLDEITSALDPAAAHGIEQLILRLNQTFGVTIIWVTHNLEQARTLSDDTWFMANGEVLLAGATADVFNSNDARVIAFLNGGAV